ncbi:hypothetical protein CN386_26730 [Bacillus cereus]|nr:hypothetical protein CN386_26730 [Bacillus cereus]
MNQLTVNEQSISPGLVNHSEDPLKGFTHELDYSCGSLGNSVATLVDVESLLANLVEGMNEAAYKGQEMAYYREHHRKLRVYWRLLNHTTRELNEEYEKVDEIKDGLFKEVVKNGKKQ